MSSLFQSKDLKEPELWFIQCQNGRNNDTGHIMNANIHVCSYCYHYSHTCGIKGLREYLSTSKYNECSHETSKKSLEASYFAFQKHLNRLEKGDQFLLASKVVHSLVDQAYSHWLKKVFSIKGSNQLENCPVQEDVNFVLLFSEFLDIEVARFRNNFEANDVWSDNLANDDTEECYSLFILSLCHGRKMFMDSTYIEHLDEKEFTRSILSVIDSDCWKSIVAICENCSILVNCQTPLISKAVEWFKGLNYSEIADVCGDHDWQIIIKQSYEYLSDVHVDNDSFSQAEQQRHINRLIQTLQMAATSDDSIPNPFTSWTFRGLILSPLLQPMGTKTNRDIFLQHSCLPNTELRVYIEDQILQFYLKTMRDIADNENLTYSFGFCPVPCRCLRCLSKPQLIESFSNDLLQQLSALPDLRDSLHRLFTCFATFAMKKRERLERYIPKWQGELRIICNILEEKYIELLPKHDQEYPCGNWLQWRSFADFLAASCGQFSGPKASAQLAGSIAIYFALLLQAVHFPQDHRSLQSKAEVSLSLVAAVLEILTTQAQSKPSAIQGLSLQLTSKKEELILLNIIATIGLEGFHNLDVNQNTTANSLRNILAKQDAFQSLTSITPLTDSCESDNMKIFDSVSDSGETLIAAISPDIVFSPEECRRIIMDAENTAAKLETGWTTSRHYSVPTTDIPITELSEEVRGIILHKLSTSLLPFQFRTFSKTSAPYGAFVFDLFVVKYNAETIVDEQSFNTENDPYQSHASIASRQRFLPLHRDQSAHSAVVALNQYGIDFTGGGTYIPALLQQNAPCVVFPDIGKALTFSGNLLHSGDAVLRGCRYIIAAFFVLFEVNDSPPYAENSTFSVEQQDMETNLKKGKFCTPADASNTFSFSFFS